MELRDKTMEEKARMEEEKVGSIKDPLVKCCRCKNKHLHSERVSIPDKNHSWTKIVCPRCGAESYYNLTEKKRLNQQ